MLGERPAHGADRARRSADRLAEVRSGAGEARNQVARRGAVDHRPHLLDEALHGIDPSLAALAAGPRADGIGAGSASGADDLGASAAVAAGDDRSDVLADVADAVAVGVVLVLVRDGGTVVAGVAQAVAVGVELIGVVDRRTVVREGGAAGCSRVPRWCGWRGRAPHRAAPRRSGRCAGRWTRTGPGSWGLLAQRGRRAPSGPRWTAPRGSAEAGSGSRSGWGCPTPTSRGVERGRAQRLARRPSRPSPRAR